MKRYIAYLLSSLIYAAIIFSCIDMNSIQADAATATAEFTDSRSRSLTMQCPGSYYVYATDGPHDMDAVCLQTHRNGCCGDHSDNGAVCVHFDPYDGRVTRSDIYGKLEIITGHWCRYSYHGAGGTTGCSRTRKSWTRCNVCGAVDMNGTDSPVTEYQVCPRNPHGSHYIQLSSDGVARCQYCGSAASNTYGGKCSRRTSQNKKVSWTSGADYIDVANVNQSQTFDGPSDKSLIVKYNEEAKVYVKPTSSYDSGSIVGYKIVKNGVEGDLTGESNIDSVMGYSEVDFNEQITDLTKVQFHIYTNAGDYYLPTVTLIPGTVITYDPNNVIKNIYDDNYTTTATGTMEKTVILPSSPVNLSNCSFKRKGYYFIGWSTDPNVKVDNLTSQSDYELQAADLKDIANSVNYNAKNILKGVTGESTDSQGAWKGIHTITLYAIWAPNYYRTYYEKGLTDDTIHTDIANGTRNNNIQSTGINRPYTHDVFDRNMGLGTIGKVLGRNYTLTFNSNRPSSVSKQLTNSTAVPVETSKVTGYLPSLDKWKISNAELNNDSEPTMNTAITQPNYKSTWNGEDTATALWQNKELTSYETPTLNGWKFVGWYDNQSGSNSTAVSNTTDMIRVVNTTNDVSPDKSVTAVGNVTSYTVQPKTTKFEQTLYARWQRTIHLTFDMNGGKYQGSSDDVVLNGIYYNNADGYEFSMTPTPTTKNLPNYETQQNQTDAYGTYGDNGENNKYTRYDENGIKYRFLGWSTNKNAEAPDNRFIVYNSARLETYRVYDDTTLYAIWEPVLVVNANICRTLGDLNFNDGTHPISNVESIIATSGTQYIGTIIKPGEQGKYNFTIKGKTPEDIYSAFDTKITDIYTHDGQWTDNLNPSTGYGNPSSGLEDLVDAQKHGLDRHIVANSNYITRKFYVPQYLGTSQSYETSKGITTYNALFEITQKSFFYNYVYHKLEQVEVEATIYITTSTPSGSGGSGGGGGQTPPAVISVLDELRTKIKMRLK